MGTEANIVQASNVQIADQTLKIEKEYENSVRSEIIGWRYKTVNGDLYRRKIEKWSPAYQRLTGGCISDTGMPNY